jgi:hypothetical protein
MLLMNCKGKHVALATAAVAVLLSIVAAFAAKDWIREQWWLHQLRYGESQKDIEEAAQQLGEFGSIDALADLIRALDCKAHHHRTGELCEAFFVVRDALKKLYLRFTPTHRDHRPLKLGFLLQHIVDHTFSEEAREAAEAFLTEGGFPLIPEEVEGSDGAAQFVEFVEPEEEVKSPETEQ